jgi:predicted RNase H-like nuclease (RuvC/YqgF family)
MEEMRTERDRYKKERDELRDRFERLENTLHQMRTEYQTEKSDTDRKIAQLGRKVEAMRPFLCGDMLCKKRQRVAILDGEDAEPEPAKPEKTTKPRKAKTAEPSEPKDLEPIKGSDL